MGRIENVQIFEDTMKMCKSHPTLIPAIRRSTEKQVYIPEAEIIPCVPPLFAEPTQIVVSKKRTFEAAMCYPEQAVCVLNFASWTNPGGGVTRGSTAQEEALCRCSTLYCNLVSRDMWTAFYGPHRQRNDPFYNSDCIYTPDVVIFKTDTPFPETMTPKKWRKVNVISCAAPNLRRRREQNTGPQISANELRQLHIKRMRRILDIAAAKGNEVVVLGAFGCGAFMNPPEIVATALQQVANEYKNHFKVIEFAVYCPPGDDRNYQVFRQVIFPDGK